MLLRQTAAQTVRTNRRAFTLLEVLIVVAIIVMLAGVGGTLIYNYYENSKVDVAKLGASKIVTAAKTYATYNQGQLPSSLDELTQPFEGRKPLLEANELNDPWGHRYVMDTSSGDVVVSFTNNGQTVQVKK